MSSIRRILLDLWCIQLTARNTRSAQHGRRLPAASDGILRARTVSRLDILVNSAGTILRPASPAWSLDLRSPDSAMWPPSLPQEWRASSGTGCSAASPSRVEALKGVDRSRVSLLRRFEMAPTASTNTQYSHAVH
jgi:hypothetical protein